LIAAQAALLGILDHGQADAVLDRAAGVLALELDPDFHARVEKLVDAQFGRVADEFQDAVELGHGDLLCGGTTAGLTAR
jgi:hypothetical protein